MNPRFSKKTFIAAAGIVALALTGAFVFVRNGGPVVALHGLDDREAQTIRNLAGSGPRLITGAAKPVNVRRTSRADIIVTRAGLAARSEAIKPAAIPGDIIGRTVPSLRRAVEINGVPSAMPLFLDHFELAWNKDRLSSMGLGKMNTIADMEHAMAAWATRRTTSTDALEKSSYAFVFAGGDDETLLLLLSALCVSEGGLSAYDVITRSLIAGTTLDAMRGMAIGAAENGTPLTFGSILDRVASWNKTGYLHPEWYTLQDKDVKALLEGNLAFMSAELLSFHRTVDYDAIAGFSTGRFPLPGAAAGRALVAPLTIAVVTARGGRIAKALDLIRSMTDPAAAREAATTSGRSTTIAAAAGRFASELREWLRR